MKNTVLRIAIALSILCSACSKHSETPNEAATAIRDLIKEKKYDVLFSERYSEWYKVKEEGIGKDEAVAKLSGMLEKQYDVVVSIYDQLATSDFTISEKENPQEGETGKVASTVIKVGTREVPFKLYEMKDGTWGFHL